MGTPAYRNRFGRASSTRTPASRPLPERSFVLPRRPGSSPRRLGPRCSSAARETGGTMDTAVHAITPHALDSLRAVPSAQSLAVSAIYRLSEAGRKASLLTGGNGKGVQRLTVQVPSSRLHLVSVGQSGHARLKLNPRFDRVDGVVVRREGPPTYDAPPTLADLFREAAKNHELARAYLSA